MPNRNKLLAALPRKVLQANGELLEPLELQLEQTLHEPGQKIDYVYFPVRGVISMVNEPNPGEIVEFATIGPEGMAGFPVLLGSSSMPSRSLVQIPGEGFRMRVAALRQMLDESPETNDLMLRYTMALVTQIAQITSCNRLHAVQQRCARWLLQTHDRVDSDSFPLKQEFLAQMLGVHRPSVSVAAGMLQKEGLIEYSRGRITVLDRKGLERASCSCYGFITKEYDRLIDRK
jgi:CRP-like cAMP-binding protein